MVIDFGIVIDFDFPDMVKGGKMEQENVMYLVGMVTTIIAIGLILATGKTIDFFTLLGCLGGIVVLGILIEIYEQYKKSKSKVKTK